MTTRKAAHFWLGAAVALFFIWLIGRQVNPAEIVRAFAGTRSGYVAAALAAFGIGYACRIARWRAMLARDNPQLSWTHCVGPLFASFAANNVLPFRAGDVLRAFAFNARLGVSSGTVLATLFIERLLDLLMVLVLLGAALLAFGLEISQFAGIASTTLIMAALIVLAMLFFPQMFGPFARLTVRLVAKASPHLSIKLEAEINRGLCTLGHLASGGNIARLIAWSIAAWLAEGCVFWLAALALSGVAVPAASWLALPVGTLATLIPSTPGYVGTFDYFVVHAMVALGNTKVDAAAFALLVHMLLWLPPTIVGGLYVLIYPAHKINPKD